MQRGTGINAELQGNTTQQTVSGRAISERKAGGLTIQARRFQNQGDADQHLAEMSLSMIQQFYPPEKLKRIIGAAEMSTPLGPQGRRLFDDPVTGEQISEDEILERLSRFSTAQYDIVVQPIASTPTERQEQFERGTQILSMVAASGRQVGPRSIEEWANMADMPGKLREAIKADLSQPPTVDPATQNAQLQQAVSNIRGGDAGGSPV